jgi:hypothetical protein
MFCLRHDFLLSKPGGLDRREQSKTRLLLIETWLDRDFSRDYRDYGE